MGKEKVFLAFIMGVLLVETPTVSPKTRLSNLLFIAFPWVRLSFEILSISY